MIDAGNIAVGVLVVLLAANYVVTRTSFARRYPPVFWAITAADATSAVAILLLGMPGIEGRPLVRVMIALVILLHLSQNFLAKSRWDAEDREDRLAAELDARRAAEEEEEVAPPPAQG